MAEIKKVEAHINLLGSSLYIGDAEVIVEDGRVTKVISFLPNVKDSNESDAPAEAGFDEDQRPGAADVYEQFGYRHD